MHCVSSQPYCDSRSEGTRFLACDQTTAFSPDDLRLLGTLYLNDFPLVFSRDGNAARILPPAKPWIALGVMTGGIACIFGIIVTFIFVMGWAEDIGWGVWIVIALITLLGTFGPIVLHSIRIHCLQQESPLLEYCGADHTFSVRAHSHRFESSEVYALAAVQLANNDGENQSELQLLVRGEEGVEGHLIATSISGDAYQTFGKVVREFADATGLLAIWARSKGASTSDGVGVRVLVPERREGH